MAWGLLCLLPYYTHSLYHGPSNLMLGELGISVLVPGLCLLFFQLLFYLKLHVKKVFWSYIAQNRLLNFFFLKSGWRREPVRNRSSIFVQSVLYRSLVILLARLIHTARYLEASPTPQSPRVRSSENEVRKNGSPDLSVSLLLQTDGGRSASHLPLRPRLP